MTDASYKYSAVKTEDSDLPSAFPPNWDQKKWGFELNLFLFGLTFIFGYFVAWHYLQPAQAEVYFFRESLGDGCGPFVITRVEDCVKAVKALARDNALVEMDDEAHSFGCSFHTEGKMFLFNTNRGGKSNKGESPICKYHTSARPPAKKKVKPETLLSPPAPSSPTSTIPNSISANNSTQKDASPIEETISAENILETQHKNSTTTSTSSPPSIFEDETNKFQEVFPSLSEDNTECFPLENKNEKKFDRQNLVLVRSSRVAGSSFAGVLRHIAAHHELAGQKTDSWIDSEPGIWTVQSQMKEIQPKISDLKERTFFITILREPKRRCMSQQNHLFREARSDGGREHYFRIRCTSILKKHTRMTNTTSIEEILSYYHLIGIAERFNETLVLLKHMLGLEWRDIVYLSANVAGSGGSTQKYSYDSEENEEVRTWMEEKWENDEDDDYYGRAVETFERKIATIPNFQKEVKLFEKLLDKVQRTCGQARFSLMEAAGMCYYKNIGCAHECLDHESDRLICPA